MNKRLATFISEHIQKMLGILNKPVFRKRADDLILQLSRNHVLRKKDDNWGKYLQEAHRVTSLIQALCYPCSMTAYLTPLNEMSGLGLLWTSLSGVYIIKGLYQVMAGSFTHRDFDGQKGLLRFNKRPIRRLFLGISLNGAVVIAAYNSYCFGITNFGWLQNFMDRVSPAAVTSTDEMSVLVGSSLLFAHTASRLYRGVYVNIFSSSLTQDIVDWLAPHLYTALAGVTILSAAPPLDGTGRGWFDWSSPSWRHLVGVGLYFLLSYQDSKQQQQLAKLRKNRAGHVVSEDHKLPKGGAFDYITSPQFLTEILVHGSIGITLGFEHQNWWLCTLYVAVSHTVRAIGRQQWYKKKFVDTFPKGRKAIIPYIL